MRACPLLHIPHIFRCEPATDAPAIFRSAHRASAVFTATVRVGHCGCMAEWANHALPGCFGLQYGLALRIPHARQQFFDFIRFGLRFPISRPAPLADLVIVNLETNFGELGRIHMNGHVKIIGVFITRRGIAYAVALLVLMLKLVPAFVDVQRAACYL